MIGLIFVAFSVGLDNFAAAIGMGVAGADAGARLRIGLVFGVFEAGMPILGLAIGSRVAHLIGGASHWLGAALLIAVGTYGLVSALRGPRHGGGEPGLAASGQGWRLPVTALALSLDNLTVGFALGGYHVNLVIAAGIFGVVSVVLSLLGLELGDRLGAGASRRGELFGAVILLGVGVAILAGVP